MSQWKKVKLSELGEIVGGATPSTKRDDYYNGSIPWLTPKDLAGYKGRYIARGERNITKEGLNSCSAKLMPKHSILFTSRAPIGYIAISENEICTNQGFKSIIPNESTDYRFLYYLLQYNKERIEAMGSGTTFKEVSGAVMKNIEVEVPKLEEQKAIAEILSCLDDKIELNNCINKNLEAQAQAIFKSWFENFEPFQDSEFVDSELGKIPMGWKIVTLNDACKKITDGSHYSPKHIDSGDFPMLSVKDMDKYGFNYSSCKMISNEEFLKMVANDCVPQIDDILVAKDGSYLKEIFIINKEKKEAILSSIAIFRANKEIIYPEILLHLLKSPSIQQIVKDNYVSGSALPRIVLKDFKKLQFVIPPKQVQERIISVFSTIRKQIAENQIECNYLINIRDTILPKLMSREIRVPLEV